MVLRVLSQEPSRKSASSQQHNEQPKQGRKYETEETSRVCEECQQIDFSRVFELDMTSLHKAKEKGILIAQLGERVREPPSNDCSLCILFFEVRMSTVQHSVASKFELRAYSYLQSTPQLKIPRESQTDRYSSTYGSACRPLAYIT